MTKILLIDAGHELLDRASSLAHAVNAEILTASSGESGLEMARKAQPDYVVISRNVWHRSNSELAERVRNISPNSFVELVEGSSGSGLLSRVITFLQQ